MGSRGERKKKIIVDKTKLVKDLDDIIEEANVKKFFNGRCLDIVSLIKHYGLKIVFEDLPSRISGYLKRVGEDWIVGVNKNHHPKRQRFTLAHEFAHYHLHRREDNKGFFEDTTFFRNEAKDSIEYSANKFAGELLMPNDLFLKAVEEGMTRISDLADAFDVSSLAVEYRAKSLNLI